MFDFQRVDDTVYKIRPISNHPEYFPGVIGQLIKQEDNRFHFYPSKMGSWSQEALQVIASELDKINSETM